MDPNTPTVVLPCPPDQFRDFIAGLLGRAQTIETIVDGPFEVTKDSIENLFHLLQQRVSSQNEATLVQFTTRIVYNDNSSALLNSLQDFLAYNEVRPLISIGLHLSWTYLIKFQNKPFPEKQLVQVSFDTAECTVPFQSVGALQLRYRQPCPITLRIEHTDRTWGAHERPAAGRSVQAPDLGHLKIDGQDGLIGLLHPTRASIGSYRWRASLGAAAPLPRVQ